MPEFKLEKNGLQHRFLESKAKVQVFGGGFGNGKTSAAVVKALKLAKAYPGSNGLIARETYPKLNDTIRKEFLKWCPPKSIKSFPMSANSSNTCTLQSGTTINFRYIAQQNKSAGQQSTSNLLSATYDWAIIDQVEDPQITYKDFLDILGRMRGNTPYVGDDPSMPRTGPRWIILTCNPTRNWVYTKLVRPLQLYKEKGIIHEDLLCLRNPDTHEPILGPDGKPHILLELFEGSTYENQMNLGDDFIYTLESAYQGQMRDRFLYGKWASYEGLVYPQFDEFTHCVSRQDMLEYITNLIQRGVRVKWLEGFDYGLSSPSCYILYFMDDRGNVHAIDGYYQKELSIEQQVRLIQNIRATYGLPFRGSVIADPSTLKRQGGTRKTVGKTIAELFAKDEYDQPTGINFVAGNNDIHTGIVHVGSFLNLNKFHINPYTGDNNAPHFYCARELQFLIDEFGTYAWKVLPDGTRAEEPIDRDDHAMDNVKYVLSTRPKPALSNPYANKLPPWMLWNEDDTTQADPRKVRYG